ncbi:MAG: ATP-binding protein [Bacillota bacterium]|nr:ATP-binding protein [Bacillota bacterium]
MHKVDTDPSDLIGKRCAGQIRTFLDELKNETDNYGSIHSLTRQITYDYHSRFLIELLQNAHDALHDGGKVQIVFNEDSGTLYVANTGKNFSQKNFESISKLGQSTKDPETSIGNKGIGFKSVLEITKHPRIYSGPFMDGAYSGYCFHFTPQIYEGLISILYRFFSRTENVSLEEIIGQPVLLSDWDPEKIHEVKLQLLAGREDGELIDVLQQEIEKLSPYQLPIPNKTQDEWIYYFGEKGYSTVVQLPLDSKKAIRKVVNALENLDAKTLLFLPKLAEVHFIHIVKDRQKEWKFTKSCEGEAEFQQVTLFEDGQESARYFLSSEKLTLGSDGFTEALLASADNMPSQWLTLKEATVSIAIEQNASIPVGLFYIYFPTEKTTELPLCLNGPFFGDMSRKHIDTSIPWNAYLTKEAGKLVFQLVQALRGEKSVPKECILDLLAFTPPHKDQSYAAPNLVFEGLNEALNEREIKLAEWKVIPTDQEKNPFSSINEMQLVQNWEFLHYLHPKRVNNIALYNLDNARRQNYKQLGSLTGYSVEPGERLWAIWVGQSAKRLIKKTVEIGEWQAFYEEVNEVYKNLSSNKFIEQLQKQQIFLCSDGTLQTIPGEKEKILFLLPSDLEVAKRTIPTFIANRFVFLHSKINITDESGDSLFLESFVEEFNVEMLMEKVVLPAYGVYTAEDQREEELNEMLIWLNSLMKNSSAIGEISDISEVLVPCRGGWMKANETFASSDWEEEFEHAPALERLFEDCDSKWVRNLLLPYESLSSSREGISRGRMARLFRVLGVTDCFRLTKGEFFITGNHKICQYSYRHSFPDKAEPLMRQWALAERNPNPGRYLQYKVESWMTPQLDILLAFSGKGHPDLPHVLLSSINHWESSVRLKRWDEAIITRERPNVRENRRSLMSLLLANTQWLPDRENKRYYRPNEIVYIPKPMAKHTPIPYVNKEFAAQMQGLADRVAEKIELLHGDVPSATVGGKLLNYLAKKFTESKQEHEKMFKSFYNSVWENFLVKLQDNQEDEFPEIKRVLVQTDKGLKSVDSNEAFYLATNDEKGLRKRLLTTGKIDILYAELSKKDMLLLQKGYEWRAIQNLQQIIEAENTYAWNGVPALNGGERKWLPSFILAIACFAHGNSMKPDSRAFHQAKDTLEKAELFFTKYISVTWLDEQGKVIQREKVDWVIDHKHKKWMVKYGVELPHILAAAIAELLDNSTLFYPLFAATRKMDSMQVTRREWMAILEEMGIQEDEIDQVDILLDQELPIFRDRLHPVLLALGVKEEEVQQVLQQESVLKIMECLVKIFGKEDTDIFVAAMGKSTDFEVSRTLYEQYGLSLSDYNRGVKCPRVGRLPIINENLRLDFQEWKTRNRALMLTPIRMLADLDNNGNFYKHALLLWDQWKLPESWLQEDWELDEGKVVSEAKIWLSQFDILLSDESFEQEIEESYGEILAPEEILKVNQTVAKRFLEELLDLDAVVRMRSGGENSSQVEMSELLETAFPGYMLRFQWRLLSEKEVLHSLMEQFPLLTEKVEVENFEFKDLKGLFQVTKEEVECAKVTRKDLRRMEREAKQRQARTLVIDGMEFEAAEENLPDMWTILAPLAKQMNVNGGINQRVQALEGEERGRGAGGGGRSSSGGGQIVTNPSSKEQTVATGYAGEVFVYYYLKELYPDTVTLESWVSGNRRYFCPGEDGLNDYAGYDFKFYANSCEYQIEVKTSRGNRGYFEMGSTETDAARDAMSAQQAGKPVIYLIAFITDVFTHPSMNFLPNPFSEEGHEFYSTIRDSGAKVWFRV